MSKSNFFMNAYFLRIKLDFLHTISFYSMFLIDIMDAVCIQGENVICLKASICFKKTNYYLKNLKY